MTARAEPAVAPGSAAEVIVRLVWVLRGNGERDAHGNLINRGLMSRIYRGEQHVPTCQKGYYAVAGDSQRGGQPCSDRCLSAQEALRLAAEWLYAHRPPTQLTLEEAS